MRHRREGLGIRIEREKIGGREKVQQLGTKQLEKRTCRYVSRFLLYHHLVSIFPDFLVF